MNPLPDVEKRGQQRRGTQRVACLLVPDLSLRAELRANPTLEGLPFVIAAGGDARADVLEVSPAARRAGVRAGGSVIHARAICSDLRVRVLSPALERAARQALLDVGLSFSPRAEPAKRSTWAFASEAAVFLDASGIAHSYHSERHFASAVGARAERLGLPGVVAIASARNIARIIARRCVAEMVETAELRETCVLASGDEASFLAPLPIDLLDPDDRLAEQLTRFGIHRIRDLLRLPRRALAQRLGPEVLQLVALAQGEQIEAPLSAPVDARLEEAIDLEFPLDQLEPLLFVLRGLTSRLVERLSLRHLACGPLDLQLDLEGGASDVRRVGVAAPTRDVRVLLRLLALALETHPPDAPVTAVSVTTMGRPARSDQLDLFRPRGPDPNKLDRTLSELESLCGAGRVGSPQVADDHRPDAYYVKPFQPHPASPAPRTDSKRSRSAPKRSRGAESSLAVRAIRPPVSAQVQVDRGLPTFIRSAVASGRIVQASGPWRTTGRWWSETDHYALDYYDAQVDGGTVVRLCFDWLEKSWRIDGIYD